MLPVPPPLPNFFQFQRSSVKWDSAHFRVVTGAFEELCPTLAVAA